MQSPLNYTVKAVEQFRGFAQTASTSLARGNYAWLADTLSQATVFVLPDRGELLDRSKPSPEVPGLIFRPPFPVVALEYHAPSDGTRQDDYYTAARCSRRIALAWEWMPVPERPEPGVAIASIAYYDDEGVWNAVSGGYLLPYDGEWISCSELAGTPFFDQAVSSGKIPKKVISSREIRGHPLPIIPEALRAMILSMGMDAALDTLHADLFDEVNAYRDLCYTLACGNVIAEKQSVDPKLNRRRAKAGRIQFPDFHILKLRSGENLAGDDVGSGGTSPRPHLRRGHIRRLGAERITWVNSAMVRGRGAFLDKQYAVQPAKPGDVIRLQTGE